MPKLKQYVGLDVSLAETSIAVIDETDKVVWRGVVASTPEAIAEALMKHAPRAERVGLESGQLASWLYHGLKTSGWPVFCIDARHAKAALSLKVNKTDANDALGLAQIMRVGWYREVAVKGHTARRCVPCSLRAPRLANNGLITARRAEGALRRDAASPASASIVPDLSGCRPSASFGSDREHGHR